MIFLYSGLLWEGCKQGSDYVIHIFKSPHMICIESEYKSKSKPVLFIFILQKWWFSALLNIISLTILEYSLPFCFLILSAHNNHIICTGQGLFYTFLIAWMQCPSEAKFLIFVIQL